MSKEEIKERAEAVARELGYDTSTLSLNLINLLDMYCMGYAFGISESKQEAIEFFKWNASQVSEYLDYLRRVDRALGNPSQERDLHDFEHANIERRYELYRQSKNKQ